MGLTVRALIDDMAKLVQQQNLTYWHFLFTYRTEFRGASAYRSEKEYKGVTGSSTYSDDDSAVDGDLPNIRRSSAGLSRPAARQFIPAPFFL